MHNNLDLFGAAMADAMAANEHGQDPPVLASPDHHDAALAAFRAALDSGQDVGEFIAITRPARR